MTATTGKDLLALLQRALARAGEAEAEAYARVNDVGFARFAIGALTQHMHVFEPEIVVRVARGARVASASTSALDEASIARAVARAAEAARLVPEADGFPGFSGADEAEDGRRDAPPRFADSTAKLTDEERVELLAPTMRAIRDAGMVSAGVLSTSRGAEAVATTRGCARHFDSTSATFKVWALETAGAGGAAGFGGQVHRDVRALDLRAQTERALRIAKTSTDPISLDAGTYDVVMEPEAVSELLEWLATITFGAPDVEQGTSPVAGRAGERVTGERITITEDPLDASDLGFGAPFDREGVARRRVPLVERGVAQEILYDRVHAARMNARSTGSALLPEFAAPAGVGPCALSMEGGEAASVDELIAGVDRGLYVCRLHYVNGLLKPRRAVMTGLTRDGCFLIEKGKLTRAVGNMRFTDSFLEGLERCDGLTRARVAIPTWWSSGGVCVVPAIRMRAFRFNGKSQERLRSP